MRRVMGRVMGTSNAFWQAPLQLQSDEAGAMPQVSMSAQDAHHPLADQGHVARMVDLARPLARSDFGVCLELPEDALRLSSSRTAS